MEDVLKAAVHALAEEGHNGVGRITSQDHASLGVPGGGAHGAQQSVGVGQHLLHRSVDAANLVQGLGVVGLEEGLSRGLVLDSIEGIAAQLLAQGS